MAADDSTMADTSLALSINTATKKRKHPKNAKPRELFSATYKQPAFAYANLEVVRTTSTSASDSGSLDALQVRSYCEAALKQFMGATGAGMPFDLLKMDRDTGDVWVRLPQEDLACFAAALAAWGPGASAVVLRLKSSGNWLGSLVGRRDQQALWTDT